MQLAAGMHGAFCCCLLQLSHMYIANPHAIILYAGWMLHYLPWIYLLIDNLV